MNAPASLLRRLPAGCLAFLAAAALAQAPAPKTESQPEQLPEPGERIGEPQVRIPIQKGDTVEPVRRGGVVVALRVTTKQGKVYYLIDTTGNGNWMRRDSLDSGLSVPMWPIKEFH